MKPIDMNRERLKKYFAGYLYCPKCLVFHPSDKEMKRVKKLDPFLVERDFCLTDVQRSEAHSFPTYRANNCLYFINEAAMVDYYNYQHPNKQLQVERIKKATLIAQPTHRSFLQDALECSDLNDSIRYMMPTELPKDFT